MADDWFFIKNSMEIGPISDQLLLNMAQHGRISKDTRVKVGKNGEWHNASDVEGIWSDVSASDESAVAPGRGSAIPEGPIICPHCWQKFKLESINFISMHPDLLGDSVVGEGAQARFLPSHFNASRQAIDAKGMVCPDMACPRCHLRIPDTVIDLKSLFFSIVGAPSSGKSYFLSSMIWQLRKAIPKFDFAISDADAVSNAVLNKYEQQLFLNPKPDAPVALPKTQQVGYGFSTQVLLDGMLTDLPTPFVFKFQPLSSHRDYEAIKDKSLCNIVLYDNAGEHFEPGRDSVSNPATKHLVHSDGLVFLFDPSRDVRMIALCDKSDPQVSQPDKFANQETLLSEMIGRIRHHGGMKAMQKYRNPLIVVVAKADMWQHLLPFDLRKIETSRYNETTMTQELHLTNIMNVSYHVRKLMLSVCPEFVATAEAFAENVLFVPGSSLGNPPRKIAGGGVGVLPSEIKPFWVDVPLLLLLASKGFLKFHREVPPASEKISKCRVGNGSIVFSVNGAERVQLPSNFLGSFIYSYEAGKWFELPAADSAGQGELVAKTDGTDDFWDK